MGFFRSTIFLLINEQIPEFARRGGKIRIICSPRLEKNDIEALKLGYEMREKIIQNAITNEINNLLLSEDLKKHMESVATLISLNILDLRIAYSKNSLGSYHEKLGIFIDKNNDAVSFKGSSNETWSGWHQKGNFESIEVFCSWTNSSDAERVHKHRQFFSNLWNNRAKEIQTYSFPEALRKKLCTIAKDSIDEIDWDNSIFNNKNKSVKIPYPHQIEAIKNWEAAGCKGILEHATGSGKTFTAILTLKKHLKKGMSALILVPSKLLLKQWSEELKKEIPDAAILKISSEYRSWKKSGRLKAFTVNNPNLESKPRIVVATVKTAIGDLFNDRLDDGEHIILIADEVHQLGSPGNSKIFNIKAGKKLGLSATPLRYGDAEGTQKIKNYFGEVLQPTFSIADAIKSGNLSEYEYHLHTVSLTPKEAEKWSALTKKIAKLTYLLEDNKGNKETSDKIKMLRIKRSRIAKKAQNKIQLAKEILSKEYQDGDKWLVYCEDQDQLGKVLSDARKLQPDINHKLKLDVSEYHSSMASSRDETLDWYKKHGGVLVSIKCLDEGVDIPDVTHALILASSQNPRQFIQRRGRILRKSPGKYVAVLHDILVVPDRDGDKDSQLSLVKSELRRAYEFAQWSISKIPSFEILEIASDFDINKKEFEKELSNDEL